MTVEHYLAEAGTFASLAGLLARFSLAAIYVFVGGIGMAGWIRSRSAGILTTTLAVISFCFISYAFIRVISLFS
jgi:hypothetical protein